MRLWSLHPKYLDSRGLVAVWREGLLAQAVLQGHTKGYLHHPQLVRFRGQPSPVGAIADYLRGVHAESVARGYNFDLARIGSESGACALEVTDGQLGHEWDHLMQKLAVRDPERRARLEAVTRPRPHPSFRVVPGGVGSWEKGPPRASA